MIPLSVPDIGPAEKAAVSEAMETGFVSTAGPAIPAFESALAAFTGDGKADIHVAAVNSGTMALQVMLTTAGIGPGDIVLCPSYTFVATANAIHHCGARPFFVDCHPVDLNIDPNALENALNTSFTRRDDGTYGHRENGGTVAGVLVVYNMGMPPALRAIKKICDSRNLPLYADAAPAIGASFDGFPLGLDHVTAATLSFNGNKIMTTGGGGAILGLDPGFVARARHLATTARTSGDYMHDRRGFNAGMTNIAAALGLAQLSRLPSFLQQKQKIHATYNNAFKSFDHITPYPDILENRVSANWLFALVCRDDQMATALVTDLQGKDIGAKIFWRPLHLQPAWKDSVNSGMTDGLTTSTDIWPRVVTLPCSVSLTRQEQEIVIQAIVSFMNSYPG